MAIDDDKALLLSKYMMLKIRWSCDYFNHITKEEFEFPNSSFNVFIDKLFGNKTSEFENALVCCVDECYTKNLKILLRSIELQIDYKKKRYNINR